MRKALSAVLAVYLLLSVAASAAVSIWPDAWREVITHRAPLLIVEVVFSTPDAIRDDGKAECYDHRGFYIAHDAENQFHDMLTVFVWNPFNSYCDDMILRLDFDLGETAGNG